MTDPETDKSNQESNEAALVICAQEGDERAFELLYERYNDKIHRYLSCMVGDSNVGCELTQDTFYKAWKNLPGLKSPTSFPSWLYQIARNCAHDYHRRPRPLALISLDIYTEDRGGKGLTVAGPEESVEMRELFRIAFTQVSLICRSCIYLYETEELSQREIAKLLHIRETSVSSYIRRGKEQCRQNYYRLQNEQRSVSPKKRKRSILPKRRKGRVDE